MSGSATEVLKLLRRAGKQGYAWEYTGTNHIRVTAPPDYDPGVDETGKPRPNWVTIASTPSAQRGIIRIEKRLETIGYERARAGKKKDHRERRPEPVPPATFSHQEPAPASPTPAAPPPPLQQTPTAPDAEEGHPVPKIGEVARITGGTPRENRIMPARDILANLPLAAWVLWQHIIDELKTEDVIREQTLADVEGYVWRGSRQGMITKIWPELPRPDYDATPAGMPEERRALGSYLSGSQNMGAIKRGDRFNQTVWWVRKEWNEVDPKFALQRSQRPGNWWELKVTPEEAGETRTPEPVTVTRIAPAAPPTPAPRAPLAPIDPVHRCPYCSFESANVHSLGTHKARTRGDHPRGRFPCPVQLCREVRPDADSLANHVHRDHKDLGLHTCRICGEVLLSRQARVSHQVAQHPDAFKRAPELPAPPPSNGVTPPSVPPSAAPDLSVIVTPAAAMAAAPSGSDPLTMLRDLLAEVIDLRQRVKTVDALTEENGRLRAEVERLTAENTRYQELRQLLVQSGFVRE